MTSDFKLSFTSWRTQGPPCFWSCKLTYSWLITSLLWHCISRNAMSAFWEISYKKSKNLPNLRENLSFAAFPSDPSVTWQPGFHGLHNLKNLGNQAETKPKCRNREIGKPMSFSRKPHSAFLDASVFSIILLSLADIGYNFYLMVT